MSSIRVPGDVGHGSLQLIGISMITMSYRCIYVAILAQKVIKLIICSADLRIVSVLADGGSSTTFVDELPEK